LIFFNFYFTVEGGGWRLMLFFSLHWKCGRRRGEMGTFFFGNVFFIVECGVAKEGKGVIFFTNSLWGEGSGLG